MSWVYCTVIERNQVISRSLYRSQLYRLPCPSSFISTQRKICAPRHRFDKRSCLGTHRVGTWNVPSNKVMFSSHSNDENRRVHNSIQEANKSSSVGVELELDFFGEPMTFVGLQNDVSNSATIANGKLLSNAMAAANGFLLAIVTKGLSCHGGGDEAGLELRFAHSAALSWSELLTYAAVWNEPKDDSKDVDDTSPSQSNPSSHHKSAPMLGVIGVASVLAQAGSSYVKHLDTLLKHTKLIAPGLPEIQLYKIASVAAACKDDEHLNPRERKHLQALHYLLSDDHPAALAIYCKLLQSCPGDVLALSLTMDLCQVLGDKKAAQSAAGSVAAYWNERRGGIITPSLPGFSIASSLVALGFAVGGKVDEAEQIANYAMNRGKKVCGALATWAQCHVFDARGRVSEGISAMSNSDGIRNFEGSGFLFFDNRLCGYGARFSIDREERGRGKSAALRLYENNFERVLNYSGFSRGQAWKQPLQRAPIAWRDTPSIAIEEGVNEPSPSILNWILGKTQKKKQEKKADFDLIIRQINFPSTDLGSWDPTPDDVLTWLPPTPQFLSDATLLCLRFTLNGTISNRNARWDSIRNAWQSMLDIQTKHGCGGKKLTYSPLVCITSSLLYPPSETGGDQIGSGRLAEGLFRFGELLQLGNPETDQERETAVREFIAERNPNFWLPSDEAQRNQWKTVVDDIASAIDGIDDAVGHNNDIRLQADPALRFQTWDFEARPILEHAVVYASCKSGDIESLCLARSICSCGVTIRRNSPEEWWRYSIVLGLLGDVVGSENALYQSINLGGGQGAQSTKAA